MAEADLAPVKACTKCGIMKPATTAHFDTHSGCRFGVHSICQDCQHGVVGYSAERIALGALRAEAEKLDMKVCSTCEQPKPATFAFYFNDLRRGGLLPRCRACIKVFRRAAYTRDVVTPREAGRERLTVGQKRCRECRDIKPLGEFYDAAECRDRVRPECKTCTVSGQSRTYYQRKGRGPLHRREPYQEGDLKKCGRCKQEKSAFVDFYPSSQSPTGRSSWCKSCKAVYFVKHIKCQPNSKASRRAAKVNRNARMRGKSGFVSGSTITMLREEQGGACCYCFCNLENEHVDHFIPIARGGEHEITNLVISCPSCNFRKNAKMPWDWMPDLFRAPPT